MKNYYNVKKIENFRELVYSSAEKFKNKPAFKIKENGKIKNITYSQLKLQYKSLVSYMLDMRLMDKRIAIIGKNSYHWQMHYLAAATVGVVVPLDKELSKNDLNDFIVSAECKAVFADEKIIEKLKDVCDESIILCPLTHKIPLSSTQDNRIDNLKIDGDEMSVLIFTSGTTGNSKGVCLSQNNILSNIRSTLSVVKVDKKSATLSILPLHHTYECTLNFLLMISAGACISYAESLGKIKENLKEFKPTFLVVVPALLNILNKRFVSTIKASVPKKYSKPFYDLPLHEALLKIPFWLRIIIKEKIKKELGGKIHTCIIGAADLDTELVFNFKALGIRTLQGYGLTECSPLVAGNSDFYFNAQSTGIAIPGVEIKIDQPNEYGEGEILVKGDNIMLGYYNDPEATSKVFKDGYLCTGDLGYMDSDGALYIRGRLKNVIVTTNGKNIYPEELETKLSQFEEIKESIIFSGKNINEDIMVKAKIVPDMDVLKEKLGNSKEMDVYDYINQLIQKLNETLPRYKRINSFEIIEGGLDKTTTQKIKRYGENIK